MSWLMPRTVILHGLLTALLLVAGGLHQAHAQDDEETPEELRTGKIFGPTFSPSNRALLAYERQVTDIRELFLYNQTDGTVQQITATAGSDDEDEEALEDFFGGSEQPLRLIEGQLVWRPVLDPGGRQWFAFVSSAGDAGYGLYLSYVSSDGEVADRVVPLPFQGQAGLPEWSPDGKQLVFSGSTTGTAGYNLYLFPNVERFFSGAVADASPVRLTNNPRGDLHPDWSPDGQYIAYQSQQEAGGLANWGVSLLDIAAWRGPASGTLPRSVRMTAELGTYNEYKPEWAPSGRFLAFYITQSEVGGGSENRQQDIGVLIPNTGPEGRIQGGVLRRGYSGRRLVRNVLVNESRGPEWYPSPSQHSLLYVRREEAASNPIYLADVTRWVNNEANFARAISNQFRAPTRLHEEVAGALIQQGVRLAFASQVGGDLRLQVRDVPTPTAASAASFQIAQEVSGGKAALRSTLFPGLGQFYRGQSARGWAFAVAGVATIAGAAFTTLQHQSAVDDYNDYESGSFSAAKLATLSPREVEDRRLELNTLYDDVTSAETTRNIAFAALAGVWVTNVVTSLWGPEYVAEPVYAGTAVRVERPQIRLAADGPRVRPTIALRIQF